MGVGECDGEIEGEGGYVGPQKAREGGGESSGRQAGRQAGRAGQESVPVRLRYRTSVLFGSSLFVVVDGTLTKTGGLRQREGEGGRGGEVREREEERRKNWEEV
jgi:hypothetical protein